MPTNSCQLRLIVASLSIATLVCAASSTAQARRAPPSGDSSTTVVIDAGHGGHDRGGIPSQKIPEKTMTLDVAQRLKDLLSANGYRVVMTRDSDVFVPLATRVAIANSYRDAIFVCIHFNSAKRVGADGIETYFYGRDSLPLASAVHYFVAGGAPTTNRGVRRRGYYVLRKTKIPAVLVECGFLTNPSEGEYVQTTSYRQNCGRDRGWYGLLRSLVADLDPGNGETILPAASTKRVKASRAQEKVQRKSSKKKKSSKSNTRKRAQPQKSGTAD